MRLGYAAAWDPEQATTWSHIPWHLRGALARHVTLEDVGVVLPKPVRLLLRGAYARRRGGEWSSPWRHSRLFEAGCQRVVSRNARRTGCDAVVEVHDLASPPIPFFVFHDATFRVLLRHYDEATGGVPYYPGLPVDTVRRLRDRQERVFDEATGILAMSHWLARELTAAGYPADKVTVVHPGINAVSPPVEAERHPALERRRVRLLFVGKVYYAKGGDLVLAALERLRSSYDPNITLTVAGLPAWGSPEPPPPGVDYVGRRSLPEVARLYDTHDLFVMPSRMEPFGIVFLEALARGLPCVGRNAFAMPEVIRPGENGALIERDDPDELATAIVRVLEDEHVYTSCWADRDDFARRHSWDRAATEVIGVVEAAVGGI